jgi:hypothetical protein
MSSGSWAPPGFERVENELVFSPERNFVKKKELHPCLYHAVSGKRLVQLPPMTL